MAFEKLSGVYEAIGDATAAIAALRTALELERARVRQTTPAPPPEAGVSSLRALAPPPPSQAAPPPEGTWTEPPDRDTMRSPLPAALKERPRTRGKPMEREELTPSRRAPGDPLLSVIEALHALRRSDNVVEGAALVLRTALDAIPAATGLIHVADLGSRDYVVVAASGDGNTEMVGSRTTDADSVLARAFDEMQTITLDVANGSANVASRFAAINAERTILCAPVQHDGQNLGAIELVDPTERGGFTDGDRHAMTYVGERFAEFLADRSIVL
jgi:hypothetical protein